MALLTSLGLKPTLNVAKALVATRATDVTAPEGKASASTATPANGGKPSPIEASTKPVPPGGGASDDAGARQAALAMKGQIEHRHKAMHAEWNKLADAVPKVEALIKGAQGAQKAALEAKKKLLDKRIADVKTEVDELQGDAEALANPATSREEYMRILARAKSKSTVVGLSEIDKHEGDLSKKRGEKHETHTTTSYEDGVASVEKTETTRSYGLGGGTVSKNSERESTFGGNTVRTSEEKKTNVSLGGKVSHEEKKSLEIETADGKKMKREKGSSFEISREGVSGTSSEKVEHRDGSSSEKSTTGGVERGEGKIAAAVGHDSTTTDAAGDATTKGGKGKVGAIGGKDGYGALAGGEGSLKNQRKSGFTTGAVVGLEANVVCDIGAPVGKPPKVQYPLTLKVHFGASVGVSTGHDKKDGVGKVGVEAKLAKAVTMTRTYLLSKEEATDYVDSLQAASGGGKIAATHTEFAIIAAGKNKSWDFARDMFLGESSSAKLKVGESSERGGSTTQSGKVSGDLKVVSLEASAEKSEDHSQKTKRAEDGTLEGELSGSTTDKLSGKVGIKSGVVGGTAGKARSFKTSSGYTIRIDPKKDPGGVRQKAYDACNGQQDYDKFASDFPDCVEGATRATEETGSNTVGVSILAADMEIGRHQGIKKSSKTGKGGKLEKREITGSAGGGGSLGIGNTRIRDSVDDEAHAELGADGDASLDLTKTRTATDLKKLAKAKLPFMGDKKKEGEDEGKRKGGLIAAVTGDKEEEDTDTLDRYGLKLKGKDLDAIGKIAKSNVRRWEKAAVMDYENSHEDWEATRRQIAAADGNRQVVAEALATFIGGSKSNRLDMVERFLRPDGDVSIGSRVAFPDSLKSLEPDYDKLVLGVPEAALAEVAKKEGPQKAGEFGKQTFDALEKLLQAITAAKGALAPAVRAEMMSAINSRKNKVLEAMRANAGKQSEQEEKAATEAEYRRMTKGCLENQFAQDDLFEKIKEWWAPGRTYNNDKLIYALQQLRDLYAIWKPNYARCAELGKKIGYPEGNYSGYQPAYAQFDDWEKKIHQY